MVFSLLAVFDHLILYLDEKLHVWGYKHMLMYLTNVHTSFCETVGEMLSLIKYGLSSSYSKSSQFTPKYSPKKRRENGTIIHTQITKTSRVQD